MKLLRRDKQRDRTHLLILGLPRSGTSLLSSLLGAHPDVSVVCEDFGRSWMDVMGKPVVGNKLCVPRQVDMARRRSLMIKLLNRFGLFKRWPKSLYSIEDYLKIPNLKLILIERDPEDVRKSMLNRGNMTWTNLQGEVAQTKIVPDDVDYTIKNGTKIINELQKREQAYLVSFKNLVNHTEETLQQLTPFLGVDFDETMIEKGTRWNWMYPKVSERGIDREKA